MTELVQCLPALDLHLGHLQLTRPQMWSKVHGSETAACVQATAQVRRRLAELELDMDRQQGWVRGGSKAEVRASCHALHRYLKPVHG